MFISFTDGSFFKTVLDSHSDIIAVIETDGTIQYVNKAWERFSEAYDGAPDGNSVRANYFDLGKRSIALPDVTRDDAVAYEGISSVCSNHQQKFETVLPCHSKTKRRWYKLEVTRIEASGEPLVMITHRDVTDQVLAEERFKSGFESITTGCVLINRRGKIRSFNATAEKIFGYKRDDVLGKNVKILMPEPYQRNHDGYLENYQKTDVPKILGIGREVEGLRSDGSTFSMHLGIGKIEMPEGTFYIGAVTDLSELNQARNELKIALEEADHANRAKDVFLASMSHEIRTPLNAIIGFSEALKMGVGAEDPAHRNQSLENIVIAGRQLSKLLSDLLDYSMTETLSIDLSPEKIHPPSVFANMLPVIKSLKPDIKINISTEQQSENFVYIDPGRLEQILVNFSSNAIKYSRDRNEIEFGCVDRPGNRVRVFIKDYGIGVERDRTEEIFKPFVRMRKTAEDVPGAGLGLAICKKLTEQMGGSIGVTSELGKGSTFWVEFPVA